MSDFTIEIKTTVNFTHYVLLDDHGWVMAEIKSNNCGRYFAPSEKACLNALKSLLTNCDCELLSEVNTTISVRRITELCGQPLLVTDSE